MRNLPSAFAAIACLCITSAALAQEPAPRPGRPIRLQVVIAQLADGPDTDQIDSASPSEILRQLDALEQAGHVTAITRIDLTTLENQPARLQFGERISIVTGRSWLPGRPDQQGRPDRGGVDRGGFDRGRQTINQFTVENTGTMVSITARAEDNGSIVAEVGLEQSRVVPRPQAAADGDQQGDDRIRGSLPNNLLIQSTVLVPAGQPELLGQMHSSEGGKATRTLALMSARLIEPDAAADRRLPAAQPGGPAAR